MKVTVAGWKKPNFLLDGSEITLKSKSGLTGEFTRFANEIFIWCADNNIKIDLIEKYSDSDYNDVSTWRIENESHRTLFLLRWS